MAAPLLREFKQHIASWLAMTENEPTAESCSCGDISRAYRDTLVKKHRILVKKETKDCCKKTYHSCKKTPHACSAVKMSTDSRYKSATQRPYHSSTPAKYKNYKPCTLPSASYASLFFYLQSALKVIINFNKRRSYEEILLQLYCFVLCCVGCIM